MTSSKTLYAMALVYTLAMCSLIIVRFSNPFDGATISHLKSSIGLQVFQLKHGEQPTDRSLSFDKYNQPRRYSLVFDMQENYPYFPRGPITKHTNTTHVTKYDHTNNSTSKKVIMVFNKPEWITMSKCYRVMAKCPVSCTCSNDPRDFTRADAVVFHAVRLPNMVPRKTSNQVWIFMGLEPPMLYTKVYKQPQWRHMFNWKMTYRLDSDIVVPYYVLRREPTSNKNYTAIALSKEKSAAWLVSHCETQSKREIYVGELQKHYPVDIFGNCGPGGKLNLKKTDIIKDYKFYLAFENSLCVDYTTEKYFDLFDGRLDIIPVVRGGANYRKLVPDGTYINTADFPSPRALAEYLHYLERNVTAYAALLREKDKYVAEDIFYYGFCDACMRLHGNGYSPPSDIATWLNHEACRPPADLDSF